MELGNISIGGLIGLVVIAVAIFCYYKFCIPKTEDKNSALEFITGFRSVFENIVERIISEIDITQYKAIEEFESDVYGIAYDECWEYVEEAAQEALKNSAIGTLVAKCVTREVVEEVIDMIISELFVGKMEATYSTRWNETAKASIEEDAKLQEEADKYEAEEVEVEPVEEIVEKVDEAELNPQKDEEEEFNPEDPTQEIVE